MFSIGICDDEELQRRHLRELCEYFFAENPMEYEVIEFTSGEELLIYQDKEVDFRDKPHHDKKLHLLFLDVEMGGIDGIEVLRNVEEAPWIWRIVFVSSHAEAVWKSFSIKTLEFARKPVTYQQIEKWLRIAIRENAENVMLEYVVGKQQCYVLLEDIYYLEAAGNYTYLYTKDASSLINDNLKQWQKKMEQMPMVRIHKSYLINMLHIQKWEASRVVLINGMELSVGRQFARDAKEEYLSFVKKQALNRM